MQVIAKILCAAFALTIASTPVAAQRVTRIAAFEHEGTGVAASRDGRVLVNFPRWNADVPVSVAEVRGDGSIATCPDVEWNRWHNANKAEVEPRNHSVNVQSVIADRRGNLWVLDPGAPNAERVVENAPKLVRIDLATNTSTRIYRFDELTRPDATNDSIARAVRVLAQNRVADGNLTTRDARLLINAPEDNAIRYRDASGRIRTLVSDPRLRWPDSMAEAPDGSIHVTASRIQDNDWFKPDGRPGVATQLLRVQP